MRAAWLCLVLVGVACSERAVNNTTSGLISAATDVDDQPEGDPPLGRRLRIRASVNGKYAGLAHKLRVDEDRAEYGDFHDYGYYSNITYKGHTDLPAGYWVYVAPNWYIWSRVTGQ